MQPPRLLEAGDTVRCEIDGIGAIVNQVSDGNLKSFGTRNSIMPVLEIESVTLAVPDLAVGQRFYESAGLKSVPEGDGLGLRCPGQDHSAISLREAAVKRLHHITLRADDAVSIVAAAAGAGGQVVDAPVGFEATSGHWIRDPHGMLIQLVEADPAPALASGPVFAINAPGHVVRSNRAAMKPIASYPPARPLRLGHVMLFSPEPLRSAAFLSEACGMGLSDQAQDVIAFCCTRRNSDHHVVAFAKSSAIGFHHASFQVADPDEVGRGGRALAERAGRGDWGFGRHTIGSNFFHYIQDPWGSWIEYFSDIDHIADFAAWTSTTYGMEDSLANWGPPVPGDFVHNYEAGQPYSPAP